jgi:SAM-dependent methyltransferase
MFSGMARKKKKRQASLAQTLDRHLLYEEAVQSTDEEIELLRRIYRSRRGRAFRSLREDFCGTAMLACDWARRHPHHRAYGVDLDPEVLEWARTHRVAPLGKAARRVRLIKGDVLDTRTPLVDALVALNFSYSVFKTRRQLLAYFKKAQAELKTGGLFAVDVFGGTWAVSTKKHQRKVPASKARDGRSLPKFRYVWDQAEYNPVDHHILCHIHFKFSDGSRLRKAFTYDWRLWTVPELREVMEEAGFRETDVYIHGFDEEGESDDIFRRRTSYENSEAWIAYVIGWK